MRLIHPKRWARAFFLWFDTLVFVSNAGCSMSVVRLVRIHNVVHEFQGFFQDPFQFATFPVTHHPVLDLVRNTRIRTSWIFKPHPMLKRAVLLRHPQVVGPDDHRLRVFPGGIPAVRETACPVDQLQVLSAGQAGQPFFRLLLQCPWRRGVEAGVRRLGRPGE